MKKLVIILIIVAVVSILAIPSVLFADSPDKVNGFVCPVFANGNGVVLHNPNKVGPIGEGHFTLIPGANSPNGNNGKSGDLWIPEHATNDNGNGVVGGDHLEPGDTGYTAIWGPQP